MIISHWRQFIPSELQPSLISRYPPSEFVIPTSWTIIVIAPDTDLQFGCDSVQSVVCPPLSKQPPTLSSLLMRGARGVDQVWPGPITSSAHHWSLGEPHPLNMAIWSPLHTAQAPCLQSNHANLMSAMKSAAGHRRCWTRITMSTSIRYYGFHWNWTQDFGVLTWTLVCDKGAWDTARVFF